jgi:hypothetical protein
MKNARQRLCRAFFDALIAHDKARVSRSDSLSVTWLTTILLGNANELRCNLDTNSIRRQPSMLNKDV